MRDSATHDRAGARARDVVAGELDAARARRQQARNGAQGRGLAGAVGADQADELTGADRQRHVMQNLDASIRCADAFKLQHAGSLDKLR